jgi:hypothetical protein
MGAGGPIRGAVVQAAIATRGNPIRKSRFISYPETPA